MNDAYSIVEQMIIHANSFSKIVCIKQVKIFNLQVCKIYHLL